MMQKTKTRSFLGRLLRGGAVLAMAALVLPKLGAVKADAASYYLSICGTTVTDDNKNDILGNGVFSFDSFTDTLTISGSYTNSSYSSQIISSSINGLKIYVAQNSVLTQRCNYNAITLNGMTRITGEGVLTVENAASTSGYWAIRSDKELTIQNMKLYASSQYSAAIAADTGQNSKLIIQNSYVKAKSNGRPGIYNFTNGITLDCCNVQSPSGCDLSSGSSKNADGSNAEEVIISNDIPLAIAGITVTPENKDDILGDGSVRYIPECKTLQILDNVTADDEVIKSYIDGLTVVTENNVWLTSRYNEVIELYGDTTFTGAGELKLDNRSSDECFGIWVKNDAELTISNTYLGVFSSSASITGNSSSESLKLLNCGIYASHHINDFQSGITLDNIDFIGKVVLSADGTYFINTETGQPAKDFMLNKNNMFLVNDGISIDGVQVNETNRQDVLGNGVFWYDSANKILSVRGVYASDTYDIISTNVSGLRLIYGDGTELRNGGGHNALYLNGDTTFYGSGTLKLHGATDDSFPVYVRGCTLSIQMAGQEGEIFIDGEAAYGFYGSESASLEINDVSVQISSSSCSIGGFAEFGLGSGCEFAEPKPCFYRNSQLEDNSGNPVSVVSIQKRISYGIYVAGTEVTNINADDILGNGKFVYEPSYNKLNVNGSYTAAQGNLIHSESYLTIYVSDNVTLTASNGDCIYSQSFIAIMVEKGRKVTLKAPNGCAVNTNYGLTVNPTGSDSWCELAAEGKQGIVNRYDYNTELRLCDTTVTAKATEGTAMGGFDSIQLSGTCKLQSGGTIQDGTVVGSDGKPSKNAVIKALKRYPLWIGDKHVTEDNQYDVLEDGSCVFTYIPDSNLLIIDGNYTCNTECLIYNEIPGLCIEVISDSVLTNNGGDLFCIYGDTTITGTGRLTLNAGDDIAYVCNCTLTFDGIEVEAIADDDGFYGYSNMYSAEASPAKLVLKNTKLHLTTGSGDCAAVDFLGGIELIDCRIAQPAGAQIYVDSDGYASIADPVGYAITSSLTITTSRLLSDDMVTLSKTAFPYTGSAIDPTAYLTVKDGSKTLVRDTDYSVMVLNNSMIGNNTALVRIKGIGKYEGTVGLRFTIKPVVPETVTAAAGGTATITVTVPAGDYVYQWQYYDTTAKAWKNSTETGAKTATLTVSAAAGMDGKQYRCIVKVIDTNVVSTTAVLAIKPTITTQPVDVTAAAGATAKFTIAANGTVYQWQYKSGSTWKNATTADAKTKIFSVTAADSKDGNQYRCIVKSASGAATISNVVTLKVKPTITAQPTDYTGAAGTTAKFTVTTSAKNPVYQWQYKSGSDWKNVTTSDAKTNTFSIEATVARDGNQYRCIVKSASGAATISNVVTLKVKPVITAQPTDYTGAAGTTAKFTVTTSAKNPVYQWQYKSGSEWKNVTTSDAKTNTFSIEATTARDGNQYRCIVKSASGAATNSNVVTLKVKPVITAQPTDYTGAAGTTAKFTVTTSAKNPVYQWQYKSGSEWKNVTTSDAKTNTFSIEATVARDGNQYRCIVKSASGAATISNVVTLKVKPVITAQPTDYTGAAGTTAKFTVTTSAKNPVYQWQYKSGNTWKNVTTADAKTATFSIEATAARDGNQYRCIVKSASGAATISNVVTLKVKPTITTQPKSVTKTAGTTATFTVVATGNDLIYQWQYKSGSEWKNVTTSDAKTNKLSLTATTARNGNQYRCIVKSASGASSITNVVTLTVK